MLNSLVSRLKAALRREPARTDDAEYWAFISYSHRDEPEATKLQRALEAYRVPRALVGEETGYGPVPPTIFPCFRDDSELGPAPDLTPAIKQALNDSKSLIVLASPDSAASEWVEKEVLAFKAMGKADRVFVALAHGTPEGALPRAVRFHADAAGQLTTRPVEPRWIDLEAGRYRDRIVELVSGVIGIAFDRLYRRDRIRARRRAVAWSAAAILVSLGVGAIWARAQSTRLASRGGETPTVRVENALRAVRLWPSAEADSALRSSLASLHERGRVELGGRPDAHDFSPATGRVAVLVSGRVGVWDPTERTALRWLEVAPTEVDSIRLARAGNTVVGWSAVDTYVWEVAAAEPPATLATTEPVARVSLSQDGLNIVTAYADGALEWWSAPWDRARGNAHLGARPTVLDFTPVGELAAVGGADGSVGLWAWGEQAYHVWEGHASSVTALALAHDGGLVATGDADGGVRIWDTNTSELRWGSTGTPGAIAKLAFSPDGFQLTAFLESGVGDDERRVLLWEWTTEGRAREFVEHGARINDLDFAADGRILAAGGRDGRVMLWPNRSQLGTVAATDSLVGHTAGGVSLIRFLPPPAQGLVTVGGDGTLRHWDWRGGLAPTLIWAGSPRADFHPDGSWVVTVGSDARISLWDASTGLSVWESDPDASPGFADAVFSPWDPKEILVVDKAGSVRTLLCSGPPDLACDLNTTDRLSAAAVRYLAATFGSDRAFATTRTGSVLALGRSGTPAALEGAPRNALVTSDRSGDWAGVFGRDGYATLWNVESGDPAKRLDGIQGRVTALAYSPTAERVVTTSEDGVARIWTTATGALETNTTLPVPDLEGLGPVPTAALFVTASTVAIAADSLVWLWDFAEATPAQVSAAHPAAVTVMAYDPTTDRLASGSADGSVYVGRPGRDQRVVLGPHGSAIVDVRFDSQGQRLLTRDELQRVRVFAVDIQAVRQIADSLLMFSRPPDP